MGIPFIDQDILTVQSEVTLPRCSPSSWPPALQYPRMTDGLLSGQEFSQPFGMQELPTILHHPTCLSPSPPFFIRRYLVWVSCPLMGTVEHIHIITLTPSRIGSALKVPSCRMERLPFSAITISTSYGFPSIINCTLFPSLLTSVTSATRSPICISYFMSK